MGKLNVNVAGGVQDSDFSSVRELAIHCKKEGVDLRDLPSA
jgi:hypothetical protein